MPLIYRIIIAAILLQGLISIGIYVYSQATIEPVELTECIVGGKIFTIIESY